MKDILIRPIKKSDNEIIARIIRDNLEELGLDIPGTAYFDPELNNLSAYYDEKPNQRTYLIALNENHQIIGGVGIGEFPDLENACELQKIYLTNDYKGKGIGKELMLAIEQKAKEFGYKKIYLETHHKLISAINLYEKMDYKEIPIPSFVNHTTMDKFYIKNI